MLAAEEQRAGRGRMGRTWTSPPRAALTFSLLLKPAVPPARRGWLPLLTGVAVAAAVTRVTGVETRLKWPNDLLAADAKLAGILAEAAGDAVVVGIGLNVSTEPAEFPGPRPGALPATSLRAAGAAAPDREDLLLAILAGFERWYRAWQQAGGDPDRSGLRPEYTRLCATIGRTVRAELPGGQALSGSGRRRRFGRQAAGPGLLGIRGRGGRRQRRPPALNWPAGPGANASAAARQATGTAGTR